MCNRSKLVRRLAEAVTGRTICADCADVLLTLLDTVRSSRQDGDAAAGAAATTTESTPS